MTNVEKVLKVIDAKGYTITQYPCRASLKMEHEKQVFLGKYIEFKGKSYFGVHVYKLFISDEIDGRNFHNGCSVLGSGNRIPDVLWFKEEQDKITMLEGLYI